MFNPYRRDFLYGLGASLGSIAFSSMLAEADDATASDSSGQRAHFPDAKARAAVEEKILLASTSLIGSETDNPRPRRMRSQIAAHQPFGNERELLGFEIAFPDLRNFDRQRAEFAVYSFDLARKNNGITPVQIRWLQTRIDDGLNGSRLNEKENHCR